MSRNAHGIDFDAEARALWGRLNLEPNCRATDRWNALDAIYQHPSGGGVIYVGGQMAAESFSTLRRYGITHVVNCTHGESKIPDYHKDKLAYFNFPISYWTLYVNTTNASVIAFVQPMFDFIEEAISRGESVLIHCLAGAHRAGTTGVSCLIHFAHLPAKDAIVIAKRCRPIIDSIGHLTEFLHRLEHAEEAQIVRK